MTTTKKAILCFSALLVVFTGCDSTKPLWPESNECRFKGKCDIRHDVQAGETFEGISLLQHKSVVVPKQRYWKGVVSGLPLKTLRRLKAPLFMSSEYKEQQGAAIMPGNAIRLYGLGASSMLWMNWLEELHLVLLRLGYSMLEVDAKVKPEFHPRSVQTCDDSMYFEHLRTARFARIGWCSWDFSNEGWSGCGTDSYRVIGGQRVKCQHGPGCNNSKEPTFATKFAEDAARSDITLVATWFNDDQQRWSNFECFEGHEIQDIASTKLSIPSLLNTVRTIHAANPKVWVVVLENIRR